MMTDHYQISTFDAINFLKDIRSFALVGPPDCGKRPWLYHVSSVCDFQECTWQTFIASSLLRLNQHDFMVNLGGLLADPKPWPIYHLISAQHPHLHYCTFTSMDQLDHFESMLGMAFDAVFDFSKPGINCDISTTPNPLSLDVHLGMDGFKEIRRQLNFFGIRTLSKNQSVDGIHQVKLSSASHIPSTAEAIAKPTKTTCQKCADIHAYHHQHNHQASSAPEMNTLSIHDTLDDVKQSSIIASQLDKVSKPLDSSASVAESTSSPSPIAVQISPPTDSTSHDSNIESRMSPSHQGVRVIYISDGGIRLTSNPTQWTANDTIVVDVNGELREYYIEY